MINQNICPASSLFYQTPDQRLDDSYENGHYVRTDINAPSGVPWTVDQKMPAHVEPYPSRTDGAQVNNTKRAFIVKPPLKPLESPGIREFKKNLKLKIKVRTNSTYLQHEAHIDSLSPAKRDHHKQHLSTFEYVYSLPMP